MWARALMHHGIRQAAEHWTPCLMSFYFLLCKQVGSSHRFFWKLSRYWKDESKTYIDWGAHSLDFQGLKYETKESKWDFLEPKLCPAKGGRRRPDQCISRWFLALTALQKHLGKGFK
jgi:hypothetical protein